MPYSVAEQEVIGLCIALEALDDVANLGLFDLIEVKSRPGEFEVRSKDAVHQEMFLLRLLDFVKEGGNGQLTGIRGSCLDVVAAACESRSFDSGAGLATLQKATEALRNWLTEETTYRMWLHTLDVDARLTVPRIDLLFILGNHVKHNLSRLTRVSQKVHQMLEKHGHKVELERIPLALDDMREHLQEDFFVYYTTWLAELVNNVRWGIHVYLTDLYEQSYEDIPGGDGMYKFNYPESIQAEIPRSWFWRLMNHRRSRPPIRPFKASESLKDALIYADR